MIYKKGASFPHPVYYEDTSSYRDCVFDFDIQSVSEDRTHYIFTFEYELQSQFLKELLANNEVNLNIIIQSNDNFFSKIHFQDKIIKIPKNRLSLNKKTLVQLQLQSRKDIYFAKNHELTTFYNEYKEDTIVPKNSLLGFSNTVRYDGEGNKPLLLFEYETDPTLKSEFKVDLRPETIVLIFKDDKYLMKEFNKNLVNMYVYAGLSQALTLFINKYGKEEEYVVLENLSISYDDVLDQKLYDLLESKQVIDVSLEEIDEVIYLITDNIVGKYVEAIREVSNYEY
ncbi:hypothetical protein JEOAER750_00137 [Jeotgalicoccus aerolatus]|uniref:Uncharacterized protein n=1 Tax=Jeotgalicoccus aerolatus TaxID=709510 RepID=A0ABS4HMQ4_9STAP|nr:hypothetical protein [Jeotgalicoccus aerolatus]MBP1952093.1 hypothetical protein [Jeotgalicoccus aerolatus]GGE05877.1 hypothetical protein GCM10007273_17880 [Jeotgalicoccus aerolatus]CAD2071036.1 hypothetical protein JEOAER750_00137 [Jeotgalicoccus aerolatus]